MNPWIAKIEEIEPALTQTVASIQAAYATLLASISAGGKVLICGNGGSAADSEHIVGELMKGFHRKRPVSAELRTQLMDAYGSQDGNLLADNLQGAIPAISLVSHTALITAFMNDVDPAMVFAQQVLGYGKPGDCLIALSTSGNSKNVVNAARLAQTLGLKTIGLTGETGGALASLCTVCIQVPSTSTPIIQQYHQVVYHALCAALEEALFA